MLYKLTNSTSILRTADMACIPADLDNQDYIQYLVWVSEGNTPEPADPITQSVISVTPWQIRKALNELGLREDIESAILTQDQNTKDAWQYATSFVENDPIVIRLCTILNKSDEERHALFQQAQSL